MRIISASEWFRLGIGPRIDALERAIEAAEVRGLDSIPAVREQANAIVTPNFARNFPDVVAKVSGACAADDTEVCGLARDLVDDLRSKASKAHAPEVILLVGGTTALRDTLSAQFLEPDLEVLHVRHLNHAFSALRLNDIVMMVLDLTLHSTDCLRLIEDVRQNPLTEDIPVLAISPDEIPPQQRLDLEALGTSQCTTVSESTFPEVVELLHQAVRDGRAISARRYDLATGLLSNRAFCEALDERVRECRLMESEAALTLVSVDGWQDRITGMADARRLSTTGELAAFIQRRIRSGDLACYWGSGTFALAFPGESITGARCAVQKLQSALKSEIFAWSPTPLTLSVGIAPFGDSASLTDVFSTAKGLLQEAQDLGTGHIRADLTRPRHRASRVLLLIPNPLTVKVLSGLLAKRGVEAVAAGDSQAEAMAAVEKAGFELVVLDEQAGGGHGLELLRQVRLDSRYARVPVIVCVDRDDDEMARAALECGASECLTKPIGPAIFSEKAVNLLSRRNRLAASVSILLADPDTNSLVSAATALQRHGGFQVRLASTPEDTQRRFDRIRPDILVVPLRPGAREWIDFLNGLHATKGLDQTSLILLGDSTILPSWLSLIKAPVKGLINLPLNAATFADDLKEVADVVPVSAPDATGDVRLRGELDRMLGAAVMARKAENKANTE